MGDELSARQDFRERINMTTTDAYVPLADDTPAGLYQEMQVLERRLEAEIGECKTHGRNAINKKALYESLKNGELVRLFAEEAATPGLKRTEQQRIALYRNTYATERLSWQLAEREYEVVKESVKVLQSCLTSTQARAKLLNPERGY